MRLHYTALAETVYFLFLRWWVELGKGREDRLENQLSVPQRLPALLSALASSFSAIQTALVFLPSNRGFLHSKDDESRKKGHTKSSV